MAKPLLFDVHTHTQFSAYEADADEVIRRALEGNTWLVNVGTQADTSRVAIEFAHRYPEGVYATAGLHPTHTAKSYHDTQELGASEHMKGFTSRGEIFDYALYKKLAEDEKVVAIGECGLDYYRLTPLEVGRPEAAVAVPTAGRPLTGLTEETKDLQGKVFEEHIALASEMRKPLMVHCRNAFADLISILKTRANSLPDRRGIIHFMTGTEKDARELLDLGFSFSFGGVLTFARDYDGVVRLIPLDRILLETDAPYITPVPHRGKRNEPSYVIETAKKIAEIKGISFEEVARTTTENALRIFEISA